MAWLLKTLLLLQPFWQILQPIVIHQVPPRVWGTAKILQLEVETRMYTHGHTHKDEELTTMIFSCRGSMTLTVLSLQEVQMRLPLRFQQTL